MASYIVEDSQGRLVDLFGTAKGPVGSAEGAPVARDPRAKGPDEAVSDPVAGLVKQGTWGFNAGLFALPDLAVKGIGSALGMDEKNVMTLTKIFNRGETAPRNEQERYARAITEGIGGGLLPTGVLSFVARGRSAASLATKADDSVLKAITNDTLDFIKKNPKQAFAMDAAFGAAHETLAQAVEENMSDDDPERKQFFKTYMPTAALIGGPLALATLSPAARAYKFGKKKSQELDASLGGLEKDALADLGSRIPIAPKVLAARASEKLRESLGASADTPEGREAVATLNQILNDYPQLAAAGYKANIVEQVMDPALTDKMQKAISSLPANSPAQQMFREQVAKNESALASLYDDLTPEANIELQAALSQVQKQRQELFDSFAATRKDVTEQEIDRLNMFYGPLNPDKLNGELRGILQAETELDVNMGKKILSRLGLGQGTDKNGLPIPVRDEKGQSLFPASNVEQPAVDLLDYYDKLLKGRTTMSAEMRRFITGSEPLNTLRKNVTAKIKARDEMERTLVDDLLSNKIDEQLNNSPIMARIKMVAETGAAPETVAKELETLNNIKGLAKLLTKSQQKGVPLTKAEKARLEAESGFGSLIIPETGEVRIRLGNETISFNPKTIAEDAKRIAVANNTVDMNVPEAVDYLQAAARFRNQALDKHNSVLAGKRATRVIDADQYLTLGNKVFDDFEKMILNNVPRLKKEREVMKMVMDDYRSVYEQRLPLIIGRKVNEGGATRYATPNEQVLSAAFKSAADVRNLSALIGNNKLGIDLLEKGTLNWLQSKNIFDKDGLISPKKINDVLQKNQNIVSVLPKQVQDTLRNEADTAVNVSRRLGEIKDQEIVAQDIEFDNFLKTVLRPGTDKEIILTKALANPIEMTKLVNVLKGDPDKLAALRRAVFDITKEGTFTGGSLKKYMELTNKSLKVVFDETHLKNLAALADVQERNVALKNVTGMNPRFESASQIFQRMLGVSIPGLMTYGRDVMGGRISSEGAGITLGVRLFSAMEENLQNKMLVRALTDPKVADALVNPKNASDAKLLLREVQSMGYLSRALMADIGVTSSQLAMQDRQVPIEGMEGVPVVSRGTIVAAPTAAAPTSAAPSSGASASTMLKEMPVAPPTRGMPPAALSPRFGAPPPPAPPAPGMYQALFPDDPISKMLQQRQTQMQSGQQPVPGQ
jgi:hypothetical protein